MQVIQRPASVTDEQRGTVRVAILDGTVTAICNHGLLRLRTSRLRDVMCDVVSELYRDLSGDKVRGLVMVERRKELCRVLIRELGQCDNSQVRSYNSRAYCSMHEASTSVQC